MSPPKDDPQRWRDLAGDPGGLAGRAADLVEAVREAPRLSAQTLARIEGEVLARRSPRARRGLPLGFRFALLAMVVLASVATARGTMLLWRRHVAALSGPPRHSAAPAPHRPVVVPRAPVPPALSPVARPSVSHPRRISMAAPEPHLLRPAAPPATTEAQLLARALSRLRQNHDPAGALALLDDYDRIFPGGILEPEALSARLEAVLQGDDRATALRLLDGRTAFAGRLGNQQLLTRAELRASAGRYGEAVGDFDRLLAAPGGLAPADLERALYGRAVCLGHLGRDDRARADLVAYQRRFPDGKHAGEVARLLGGAAPQHRP